MDFLFFKSVQLNFTIGQDNKTGNFELSFDEIGQQAGSDLRQFFFTL